MENDFKYDKERIISSTRHTLGVQIFMPILTHRST